MISTHREAPRIRCRQFPQAFSIGKSTLSCAIAGLRVRTSPHARNSIPFQNRPPCCGNNTCVPICPIGAKYDASVHARTAEEAGRARILDQAVAYRVQVDDQDRVSAIAFKRPDGSEQIAVGRYFVIAAHGVETPRLLLMSRSERFPDGVANSSGQRSGAQSHGSPGSRESRASARSRVSVPRPRRDFRDRALARRPISHRARSVPDADR